jgi:tetratricopeptide (TPR) repeat protein
MAENSKKRDTKELGQPVFDNLIQKYGLEQEDREALASAIEELKTEGIERQEPKKKWLRKLLENVIFFSKVVLAIGVILIAFVSVVIGFIEFTRNYIYIENFDVCETLVKQGFNSQTIKNKLSDKINIIKIDANSIKQSNFFVHPGSKKMSHIKIIGSEISLSWLIKYFKEIRNYRIKVVSGEITYNKVDTKELQLTIRVAGELAKNLIKSSNDIDDVLHQAAEYIYFHVDPYILAKYQYECDQSREKMNCVLTLRKIINEENKDNKVRAYNLWGAILHQQGNYEGAIAKYEEAKNINPNFPHTYFNWGITLLEQEKYDEATAKYDKGIEINSDIALAYFNYAYIFMKQEKYKEAIGKYDEAIEKGHNHADTYNNYGIALFKLKEFEKAIVKFEEAIRVEPDFKDAHYNWGVALLEQQKYNEAIDKFKIILITETNAPDVYNSWGIALLRQQKYNEAIDKFKKSIEIKPNFASPYQNCGIALQEQGKYVEAYYMYKRAQELRETEIK